MRVLFGLIAAAFAFQEPDEFDRAVKLLSDASIEVRDKAQGTLASLGEKALPRLRKALDEADADGKARLGAIIGDIERLQAEREIDKANRVMVLGGPAPDLKANEVAIEGAVFSFAVRTHGQGTVIETTEKSSKRVWIDFDVAAISGEAVVPIERCGTCSPALVYVKHAGPVRVKLAGIRRWASEYPIRWKDPKVAAPHRVGDFVITLEWPRVVATHSRGLAPWVMSQVGLSFDFKLKPGVAAEQSIEVEAPAGLGRGGGKPAGWCRCAGGPAPVAKREAEIRRRQEFISYEANENIRLEGVESVSFTFLKPIEEPFEVTGPAVSAK